MTGSRRLLWLLPLLLALPACQQKMAVQPSYRPDQPSDFFRDGRADRPLPEGTVARGRLRADAHEFSGRREPHQRDWAADAAVIGIAARQPLTALALADAARYAGNVTEFPFPVTREVLEHGRNRYSIYCAVCHDPLGTGKGKIVERGYTRPPSYHEPRLRAAPVGHFFEVITLGYGSMPSYREQIPPRDRWAIVAYVRALQLSQRFPERELSDEMRREWQEARHD
jgi:mono/diheme cytochrome c family protein